MLSSLMSAEVSNAKAYLRQGVVLYGKKKTASNQNIAKIKALACDLYSEIIIALSPVLALFCGNLLASSRHAGLLGTQGGTLSTSFLIHNVDLITSVPASREAPRGEKWHRSFAFIATKTLRKRSNLLFSVCIWQSDCCQRLSTC